MSARTARTARTVLAAGLAVGLLAGCGAQPGDASVPHFTVGGDQTAAPSLSPAQVLATRRAAGIAACPASSATATARSDGLPALTLSCLGGDSTVNLAGLSTGRPRVLTIWAEWCGPCGEEAPHLAEVWAQAKKQGSVDFLGINYQDPSPGKAVAFAKQYGLTFPHVVDPDATAKGPLRVAGIPQLVLVDATGRVVYRTATPITSADQLRELIASHLGVRL